MALILLALLTGKPDPLDLYASLSPDPMVFKELELSLIAPVKKRSEMSTVIVYSCPNMYFAMDLFKHYSNSNERTDSQREPCQ